MKACVLTANPDPKLAVTDVPKPTAGPGQVIVKVQSCGVCGSDTLANKRRRPKPGTGLIMGHEFSGVVDSIGPGVTQFGLGARVVCDSTLFCGECPQCLSGNQHLCVVAQVFGVAPEDENGKPYPWNLPGAFAQYVAVPTKCCFALPETVSFDQAAIIEPFGVAKGAVNQLVSRGMDLADPVLVVSVGLIGQAACRLLKLMGVKVVAANRSRERLEKVAAGLGIPGVCLQDADALDQVMKATGGGAKFAIETGAGNEATIGFALSALRKLGTLAVIGNMNESVPVPLKTVVNKGLSLMGSKAFPGPRDIPAIRDLIATGALTVDDLITATCSLDELPGWIETRIPKEKPTKVIVHPNG